jgi:uncharacterized protein YyaL (SSP411 family)
MADRLSNETSPYLLQHLDSPVDWQHWGAAAFEKAAAEDKPVFLSAGYSTCHWCHVMAHESFDDQAVAEALNKDFISIKLDREERPDVDEIYMTAVQIATGQGGWPMSVFMTPDKKPFFAGTYFPKDSRGQMPGFLTLLGGLAASWKERRTEIEETAGQFSDALTKALNQGAPAVESGVTIDLLDAAIPSHHEGFDYEHGGFGGAPKFPPHPGLHFLLRYAGLRPQMPTDLATEELANQASWMALLTLEKLCLGGIHDHVGGGFHRYTVDDRWHLPHFEKMLSDNGQLLSVLADAARLSEDEELRKLFRSAGEGIVRWANDNLLHDGLYQTAMDADSEGEEGVYYVWSANDIAEVLGDKAEAFSTAFSIHPEGNFLEEATGEATGQNVLHLQEAGDWSAELEALHAARSHREKPGTDTKAICAYNGLMIGGLARFGEVELAAQCAAKWLDAKGAGPLPRQITAGRASGPAFLDDYAYLAEGLCDLAEAQGGDWLAKARDICSEMVTRFQDPETGAFFFAADETEVVLARTKPSLDQATPNAAGSAVRALWRCGMKEEAKKAFGAILGWAERIPTASQTLLECLLLMLHEEKVTELELPSNLAFDADQISVTLSPREIAADDEGWGHGLVTIDLPDGIHINSNSPSAAWLTPTTLSVAGVLGEAGFPDSDEDIFDGSVSLPVRLRARDKSTEFALTVSFQPCSDKACFAPISREITGMIHPA